MVNLSTSIVENLDRIDVPPELETSHEELVAAANQWIDLVGRVVELLKAADPETTVGTGIINDQELDPDRGDDINHRAGLACREIELTAAANGVEADLGCLVIFRK